MHGWEGPSAAQAARHAVDPWSCLSTKAPAKRTPNVTLTMDLAGPLHEQPGQLARTRHPDSHDPGQRIEPRRLPAAWHTGAAVQPGSIERGRSRST